MKDPRKGKAKSKAKGMAKGKAPGLFLLENKVL